MIIPIPPIHQLRINLLIIIQIRSQCPHYLLIDHLNSPITIIPPSNKSITPNTNILGISIDNSIYFLISDIYEFIKRCPLDATSIFLLFLDIEL